MPLERGRRGDSRGERYASEGRFAPTAPRRGTNGSGSARRNRGAGSDDVDIGGFFHASGDSSPSPFARDLSVVPALNPHGVHRCSALAPQLKG